MLCSIVTSLGRLFNLEYTVFLKLCQVGTSIERDEGVCSVSFSAFFVPICQFFAFFGLGQTDTVLEGFQHREPSPESGTTHASALALPQYLLATLATHSRAEAGDILADQGDEDCPFS